MRIGFWSMLCILFIALKLMGYITWSWLIVLFPFTIMAVLLLVMLVIYFIRWFVRAYG